jgi:hypothetical protein
LENIYLPILAHAECIANGDQSVNRLRSTDVFSLCGGDGVDYTIQYSWGILHHVD